MKGKAAEEAMLTVHSLTRRELMTFLTGASLMGVWSLVGCGGGGGGGSSNPSGPPGLTNVNGVITLPSGSSLNAKNIGVYVMGQTPKLSATGGFSAGVATGSPAMAVVSNSVGAVVLAGFLDATVKGPQTIDAHATAVVLIYFSLGGPMLPAASKSALLALLKASSAIGPLATVIGQRVAANPTAVGQNDSQILSALETALDSLTNSSANTAPVRMTRSNSSPLLTLTPSTDQSGISVTLDNSILGIDVANFFRRPVEVYVYETDRVVAGKDDSISPAKLVAGPLTLAQATDLSLPNSLGLLTGNPNPYLASKLPAQPLALDGTSDETTYEVVIIGPSASGVTPGFFSAARYANEVGKWNVQIQLLYAQFFFVNLVYSIVLEMIGFGSPSPNSPNLASAVQSAIANAGAFYHPPTSSSPSVKEAQMITDLTSELGWLIGSGQALKVKATCEQMVGNPVAQAIRATPDNTFDSSLSSAFSFLGKYIASFLSSSKLVAGDLAKVISQIAASDPGVLWTTVLSKNEITLSPDSSNVLAGDTVNFEVTLSPDLTGTYTYVWTQSSSQSVFSAVGETNSGNSITTQKLAVNLQTSSTETTTDTISVKAYDTSSGHRVEIGTATATVTFVPLATVSPSNPALAVGAKQVFTVTVPFKLPSGAKFLWTDKGSAGTIGLGTVTTTAPSITYTGTADGDDNLVVQVVDASGILLASGGTEITVGANPVIKFTIAGDWTAAPLSLPNGTYNYKGVLGNRQTLTDNNGNPIDRIMLDYDLVPDGGGFDIDCIVDVWAPVGQALAVGQKFTVGDATDFTFSAQIPLVTSPGTEDPSIVYPGTTGTLTCTQVSTLSDGTNVFGYSFSMTNPAGGAFSGTGLGTWKRIASPTGRASKSQVMRRRP